MPIIAQLVALTKEAGESVELGDVVTVEVLAPIRGAVAWHQMWFGTGTGTALLHPGKPTTVHSLSACLFYEGRFQQPAQKDSGHARTDIASVVRGFLSPLLYCPPRPILRPKNRRALRKNNTAFCI